MNLIALAKHVASKFGVDVRRYSNTLPAARARMIESLGTDLVLDVGANVGQYARALRKECEYSGRIVSFEPQPDAYAELQSATRSDARWSCLNVALGSAESTREFFVSQNSWSSSFLQATKELVEAEKSTVQVAKRLVQMRTLDSVLPEIAVDARSIMLKLDTQGFELEVLRGADTGLARIGSIECELSLDKLYEGQPAFYEVCEFLYNRGFVATWIEREFQNDRGEVLQVDALFTRRLAVH